MKKSLVSVSFRLTHPTISSIEFVESSSSGAYTTARTLKGTNRVFQLKQQIERIVTSSRPFLAGAITDDDIRNSTISCLKAALTFDSTPILQEYDCKLTLLVSIKKDINKEEKEFEVKAHVEPLKVRDSQKPVFVAIGGPARENARVKDVKWVHDRKAHVNTDAEETLLLSKDGLTILEGSQTNFFAVLPNGTVFTAGDGILEGTVRAVVIDACQELKIPLIFEAPKVSDIDIFTEAFIASTSRLVMPIDLLGGSKLPTNRPITDQIQALVRRLVDERSISVDNIT